MAFATVPDRSNMRFDKYDLRDHYGRPLIVKVREFREAFTSAQYEDPKPVVVCDVVDLAGPNVANPDPDSDDFSAWRPTTYVGALWGGGQVVDTLRNSVGEQFAVKAVKTVGASGRPYPQLVQLEGKFLQVAQVVDTQFPTMLDDARNARMAEAAAARGQNQAPQGPVQPQAPSAPALTPMGAAPVAQSAPAPQVQVPAASGPVPVGMPAQPFAPAAPAVQTPGQGDVQAALADLNAPSKAS